MHFNPTTNQWELHEHMLLQLLRVAVSIAATAMLLAVAAGVLLACLNVQGLIHPLHSWLFWPRLAALNPEQGLLSHGWLTQVCLVLLGLAAA